MIYWLVIFPVGFMAIVITIALVLGKRDRKKELNALKEEEKDIKTVIYNRLIAYKKDYEFVIKDYHVSSYNIDLIYLSRKGIFVINTSDDKGIITGDYHSEHLINKNNGIETMRVSPYKKNLENVQFIKGITEKVNGVFPLTIYMNADISSLVNSDKEVFKLDDALSYFDSLPLLYDDTELPWVYNKLTDYEASHD